MEDDQLCRDRGFYKGNFNPRPPCGGRQSRIGQRHSTIIFQSTSPVWRTTVISFMRGKWGIISIHVPRVEDDVKICADGQAHKNFNPRPPCGGRPGMIMARIGMTIFQSTSPVWRTTSITHIDAIRDAISIHVPRVEDDH